MVGLDLFRRLTKVSIGNGRSTFFWLDLWLGEDTLASHFPALFSHSLRPNIFVASAMLFFDSLTTFHPKLSHAATLEFGDLQNLLAYVVLNLQRLLRTCSSTATPFVLSWRRFNVTSQFFSNFTSCICTHEHHTIYAL
ncbi:hypothetical protein BRADI_4g16617v3 [Brachypodium distachyon]|uniref:Reverse transcriptase zinc-binding domain-containing protein n=1 Tax=Brachypodium distachyon TaxID=15368 RepID=A0A2K2CN71_BRADI|nr:hypothetical protein BRADI_4g16617v3 [Brachypodium distachyon]